MNVHHSFLAVATSTNLDVMGRSVALVGIAELFDKTWFMGFILALRHGPFTVFLGSFTALFLHCFLAAALGLAFAQVLSKVVLGFLTAGLFFCFALMYAKDWYDADPDSDIIAAGKEECAEIDVTEVGLYTGDASPRKKLESSVGVVNWSVLGKSFIGVFIAEWGDRTQIAMIGQHASQPLIPVFLGSVVAFLLLTLSAVGAASLLNGQQLRERVVFGFSACCFAFFGLLALRDAMDASRVDASHMPNNM